MDKAVVEQIVAGLRAELEDKLNVKGRSLERQVRKAGRLLPKSVRTAAQDIIIAEKMSDDPKLLHRLDANHIRMSYDLCLRHFQKIDRATDLSRARYYTASRIALQLLLVGAALIAVLWWRGFV